MQSFPSGMLSPEGRCKTLDASADGYLRAEACGVLSLALVNGVPVASALALLVGSAVNQDGRSSSLTAPNGPAQQRVMREALGSSASSLVPSSVSALGMHGTGTPLGDPIEVGAVAEVHLGTTRRTQKAKESWSEAQSSPPLAFMSSKSWVGHAEPASGVVGLLQAFFASSQHASLPLFHLRSLNPFVTSALSEAGNASSGGRSWSLPRQGQGMQGGHFVMGASAVAYQV